MTSILFLASLLLALVLAACAGSAAAECHYFAQPAGRVLFHGALALVFGLAAWFFAFA